MVVSVSDPVRARVRDAVQRYGERVVVGWCTELAAGSGPGAVTREAALVLGGRHAAGLLDDPASDHAWWWRVWGLRGLLHVWDDRAADAVLGALDDGAWRVREGALRVIARHRVDDDPQPVADLTDDPVARVRSAAARALTRLEDHSRKPGSSSSRNQARTGQSSAASADGGSPSNART